MHKKELRKKYLELRKQISPETGKNIINNLYKLKEFSDAENIFIYVSFGSEPDTHEIINKSLELGKNVYVPKCIPNTRNMKALQIKNLDGLSEGAFGIPEPTDASEEFEYKDKSLIICPGLCFSLSGDRLGYGGGYYDRFLSEYKNRIPIVALCYEQLISDEFITEKTDIKMDIIITEERIIMTK